MARYLAVCAALPLAVIAAFQACCLPNPATRRRACIALASCIVAVGAAIFMRDIFWRARPFVYRPLNLLLAYPSDSSFPSLEITAASALAAGLASVSRKTGIFAIPITLAAGVSRVYCAVDYPLDVLVGWLAGPLIFCACVFVFEFRYARRWAWGAGVAAGTASVCVIAYFLLISRNSVLIRPRQSTYTPKGVIVSAEDKDLIRDSSPDTERALRNSLYSLPFASRITKIAVGSNGFIEVAGIKFQSQLCDEGEMRTETRKEALEIAKQAFSVAPRLEEVHVWAVHPVFESQGIKAHKVVFSQSVRRPPGLPSSVSTEPVKTAAKALPLSKPLVRQGAVQ